MGFEVLLKQEKGFDLFVFLGTDDLQKYRGLDRKEMMMMTKFVLADKQMGAGSFLVLLLVY